MADKLFGGEVVDIVEAVVYVVVADAVVGTVEVLHLVLGQQRVLVE